jgi:hypothetical protein
LVLFEPELSTAKAHKESFFFSDDGTHEER